MYATQGAAKKYHKTMKTTVQLLAPNGDVLTTRRRLLVQYPTVGFGNLQALLEKEGLTRYSEDNRYYFVATEVAPVVEAWIAQRDEKKSKHN